MRKANMKREDSFKTAAFKKAHAKALAAKKEAGTPLACKHGHDLRKPTHIHVGTLLRTGKLMCNTCWEGYAKKAKKHAAPREGRSVPEKLAGQIAAAEQVIKQLEIPQLLKIAAPGQRVMTLVAAKAANLAAAPRKKYAVA